MKVIYFAGGCFWGVEKYFQLIDDHIQTKVGYIQSSHVNPTYNQIVNSEVEAIEAVKITYDPEKIGLNNLLDYLFLIIDPTLKFQQGNDIGYQYQTGVFFENIEDQVVIDDYLNKIKGKYDQFHFLNQKLDNFYLAEDEHQNYLIKDPTGYCHIDFSIMSKIKNNHK